MTGSDHPVVRVPATTANLGPGFDAFGAAVDRHLVARSRPRGDQRERVRMTGAGAGEVSDGDDNLVWASLVRLCQACDLPVPDVAVTVTNDVPLERGLGSSSAAIVAGVGLGRALTGARMGDRELVALAAGIEGHPDNVAAAILGGLVACTTAVDGRLVVRRAQPAARLVPVVFVPDVRQATTTSRAALPDALPRDDVAVQAANAGHVLASLVGIWPADAATVGDRLHEPSRLARLPASRDLLVGLRAAGVHAWLSGAGSAIGAAIAATDDHVRATCHRLGADHGFATEVCSWDLSGLVTGPAAARSIA